MMRAVLIVAGSVLLLVGLLAPGGSIMMASGAAILICSSPWFRTCVMLLRRRFGFFDKMIRAMARVGGRRVGSILASTDPNPTVETTSTHHRSCNLCEAICGLEIVLEHDLVISIKGDSLDPLSRGHICPKAVALKDIREDPNRLRRPVKKTAEGWQEISWKEAVDEISMRTATMRDRHGDRSLAVYLGNPTVHSYGAMLFQRPFLRALGRPQLYSATSVDQLPHHFAASLMLGHSLLIPVPDVDRTDFMLIIGANPIASNGSLMTAPGMRRRLKAIRERGGKVVVIDPRRTETADVADEHHFIRPGTDVWLLAALLHVTVQEGLDSDGRLRGLLRNRAELAELVAEVTPEVAGPRTGMAVESIRLLARQFAKSPTAVCYGRIGLSTQIHGSLCQWLVNALNIVTGNFDRPGGAMLTSPAVEIVGRASTTTDFGRWRSRVREAPEFDGQLPVAVLGEEILTAGEGRIRALFTYAGNPVLSTPNGRQLDKALQSLELMVSIDIYINETTRHADFILPPTTGLEADHYDLAFNALAVRNTAKFSPAVFSRDSGARHDWQVFDQLARGIRSQSGVFRGVRERVVAAVMRRLGPAGILDFGLKIGPHGAWRSPSGWFHGLTLRRLRRSPHGLDLGPLQSELPGRLRTPDRKIDLAPAVLRQRLGVVLNPPPAATREGGEHSFDLIGRRDLRSNNSWMHNIPRLIKGAERATLVMHPDDARRLELTDVERVRVRSRVGEIALALELSDAVMPGVVSVPHGFGHDRPGTRIPVAERHAGASVNDLTDDLIVDPLIGTAAFSGQRVTVHRDANDGPN